MTQSQMIEMVAVKCEVTKKIAKSIIDNLAHTCSPQE